MSQPRAEDRAVAIRKTVTSAITKSEKALAALNIDSDLYGRVAFNALSTSPGLQRCTTDSLHVAILKCVEIGLFPDGNEAALVPFKGKATLVPMVAGLLRLAREALPGLSIWSAVVYEGDEFDFVLGSEPRIEHRPAKDATRTNDGIVAVYACARPPGSKDVETDVLWRDEIDYFMESSAAGRRGEGPWRTHYSEMARKTVLKRLLKRLPRRGALGNALAAEDEIDVEPVQTAADAVIDVEPVEPSAAEQEAAAKATSSPKPQPSKPKERKGGAAKKKEKAAQPEPEPDGDPGPQDDADPASSGAGLHVRGQAQPVDVDHDDDEEEITF